MTLILYLRTGDLVHYVPSLGLDSKLDSRKSSSIKYSGSTRVESTLDDPTFSLSNIGPDDRAEFLPEFRSKLPNSDAISRL